MNYYHELLESYSKLKKRSLTLIKEGGEAEGEPLNSVDAVIQQYGMMTPGQKQSFPHPSPAQGHEKLHLARTDFSLKAKFAKRNSAIVKQTSNPTKAAKQGEGWVQLKGDTYQNTIIAAELEEWLNLKNPDANAGDANAIAAEEKAREEAVLEAIEANRVELSPFLEDFGIVEREVKEGEEDKASEFNPADLEAAFKTQGVKGTLEGFQTSLKYTIEKWIEDVNVPIEDKVESARNLRDMVYLTSKLHKKIEDEEVIDNEEATNLKSILEKIALGPPAGKNKARSFVLNTDQMSSDTYKVLLFGKQSGSHQVQTEWMNKVIDTFETSINSWNKGVSPSENSEDFEIGGFDDITINRAIAPDTRGKADEAVMAGAGTVATIFSLIDGINASEEGSDERKILEDRRDFQLSRMIALWGDATTKLSAQQLSESLRMGIASMGGEGIDTLGSLSDEELTTNLIEELRTSYPDSFGDEGVAESFIETLASEEDGKRAFATFMILRSKAVQGILGEGVSPLFSFTVGEIAQSTKGERIKRDVSYALDHGDINKVRANLKKNGIDVSKVIEEKTVDELISSGEMKPEDFPPGTFESDGSLGDPGREKKFTILSVSLKTQPKKNVLGMGGMAFNSLNSGDYKNEGHRREVISQIKSAGIIKKRENTKGAGATLTQVKDFWKRAQPKNLANNMRGLLNNGGKFYNPDLFKAIGAEMFVLGGTAATPQLNVWNQLDGETIMESDDKFRKNILDGIGNGELEFHMKPGGKAINVFPKGQRAQGKSLLSIKILKNGKIEVNKKNAYNTHFYKDKKNVSENKDNLMTDFLKAQATLIQELLATH